MSNILVVQYLYDLGTAYQYSLLCIPLFSFSYYFYYTLIVKQIYFWQQKY